MKKLLSAFLALTMVFALAAPALAWEHSPAKYPTFQGYLDFYRSCADADTQALTAYIDSALAEDPGLPETFDADAWFEEEIADPGLGVTKGNWFGWNGPSYDEDYFRAEMLNDCLTRSYRAWRDANSAAALAARYPDQYAAFDADAWFAGYYGGPVGIRKETYMSWENLAGEEAFRQNMFADWANRETGFYNGYCVTVDGTPIQFQFYRDLEGEVTGPKAEHDRILIPLRAAAEALGFTVEWRPETGQVVCSDETKTVTFTLDSTEYSGGTLDVAPYAEKGITYLPLRALGEALGCGVEWKQDFATTALRTQE